MPKIHKTSMMKTARATPYSYSTADVTEAIDLEGNEGTAATEVDSTYFSSTENSFQESPDEQCYTHPRCFGNDHIEKLEVFAKDLDLALKHSFPPTAHSQTYPYTGVFVLLLRWMDDDLQVQREITKLHDVFAEQFYFDVEQWHIPSINSTRALQTKLYDFQNTHQSEKELLIVYYGGHSEADPRRGRSLWRANNRLDSPCLNWSSLQHLLETAVPHVLIILDCCFAANAARDTAEGSTKEILAACGRENPTLGVCDRSFTSVLVEELQAFGTTPFTVAMLHSRLVTMRWRLAFTPIYALLSENGGSSIAISPIPQTSLSSIAELDCVKESSTDPYNNSTVELEGTVPENSTLSSALRYQSSDTRVLLSIAVAQEAELDLAQWTTWLGTATPWDILRVDVQIQGVYKSHSTLVLVSVPIIAWNLLVERPAYKFIGFVRSQNLLHRTSDSLAVETQTQRASGMLRRRPAERTDRESLDVLPQGKAGSTTALDHDVTVDRTQGSQTKHPFSISKDTTGVGNVGRWNDIKLQNLRIAYTKIREEMWRVVADQVGENWEFCEAKCMTMGSESGQQEHQQLTTPPPSKAPTNRKLSEQPQSGISKSTLRIGKIHNIRRVGSTTPDYDVPMGDASHTPKATLASHIPGIHQSMESHESASPSWSPEKDELLMRARQQGLNWQPIATQHFPDKTANACRKRHERLMEQRNNAVNATDASARAYINVREQMWKLLADRVGEKWQTVEAKCMNTGLKTLQAYDQTTKRRKRQESGVRDYDEYTDDQYLPSLLHGFKSHQEDVDNDFGDSAYFTT